MHLSAARTGRLFFELYWQPGFCRILDIGSMNVNGCLRDYCPVGAQYVGIDLTAGPGVDLVLEDPYRYPFADGYFDLIVSTSCFEHDPMFWLTFVEAVRVLSDSGFLYVNAPSNGWYHPYPVDNWRFYPDAGIALVQWARRCLQPIFLVESFVAARDSDVWNDCVMVFSKRSPTVVPDYMCNHVPVTYNLRKAEQSIGNLTAPTEDMQIISARDNQINKITRRQRSISISCIETRDMAGAVKAVESTIKALPRVECLYWFGTQKFAATIDGVEIINVLVDDFAHWVEDTSRICLQSMPRLVTTDINIIVQADGFAINANAWDEKFLEYDYIGAVWPWMWQGRSGPRVGNGGFSLRSRKLYEAIVDIGMKWRVADWADDPRIEIPEYYIIDASGQKHLPEDLIICLWYRDLLEKQYGIKFCPPELANQFSVETRDPSTEAWLGRSFGFHGAASAFYGDA